MLGDGSATGPEMPDNKNPLDATPKTENVVRNLCVNPVFLGKKYTQRFFSTTRDRAPKKSLCIFLSKMPENGPQGPDLAADHRVVKQNRARNPKMSTNRTETCQKAKIRSQNSAKFRGKFPDLFLKSLCWGAFFCPDGQGGWVRVGWLRRAESA